MKSYFLIFIVLLFAMSGHAWSEVNINTASATEIAHYLKNIGPAKAAAIVEHRKTIGNFTSVDDLAQVKGIGKRIIEMNRELIVITDSKMDKNNNTQSKDIKISNDRAITGERKN